MLIFIKMFYIRNAKFIDFSLILILCLLAGFVYGKTMEGRMAFNENSEKYIVIIIDDYGYMGEGTDEMLQLGIPITAAIMPGMESSEEDADKYYEAGFDVILHQPMEPLSGKTGWLGPHALTVETPDDEVYENVVKGLESVKHAIGINNHMGSKAMENERIISQVMKVAAEKDLIFIDSKTTGNSVAKKMAEDLGVRFYERDVFLDEVKSVENTKKQMLKAGEIAEKKGYSIVIGHVGNAGGKTTVLGIKEAIPELTKKGCKFITISDLDYYYATKRAKHID